MEILQEMVELVSTQSLCMAIPCDNHDAVVTLCDHHYSVAHHAIIMTDTVVTLHV